MRGRLRCRRSLCRLRLSLRLGLAVELWLVLGRVQPLRRAEPHARERRWIDGCRLARPLGLTSVPEEVVRNRLEEGGARNGSR